MDKAVDDPEFTAWAAQQTLELTADPLWRLQCYREALFVLSVAEADARMLAAAAPYAQVAEQLLRAAGSVPANIAEGYARPTVADRGRFFSYALGSAREAESWYRSAARQLGAERSAGRIGRLTRLRRMLIRLRGSLQTRDPRARFDKWSR